LGHGVETDSNLIYSDEPTQLFGLVQLVPALCTRMALHADAVQHAYPLQHLTFGLQSLHAAAAYPGDCLPSTGCRTD